MANSKKVRKYINYYGQNILRLGAVDFDYFTEQLEPRFAEMVEDSIFGAKATVYEEEFSIYDSYMNPEDAKIYTKAEDVAAADIHSAFRICKTMINEKANHEKDPDTKSKMGKVQSDMLKFDIISYDKTSKVETITQAKNFVTTMKKEDKKVMALFGIVTTELDNITEARGRYDVASKNRKAVKQAVEGKLAAERPVFKKVTNEFVKMIDNGNDSCNYNGIIDEISHVLLTIKRRNSGKSGSSDTGTDKKTDK